MTVDNNPKQTTLQLCALQQKHHSIHLFKAKFEIKLYAIYFSLFNEKPAKSHNNLLS